MFVEWVWGPEEYSMFVEWGWGPEEYAMFVEWVWVRWSRASWLLLFSHSVISDSVTPWTAAHQAPLSFTVFRIRLRFTSTRASLVAQLVKNLPAMPESWVRSLGWEDPLEKGKATHCSILAWRIPQSMGSQRVGHD